MIHRRRLIALALAALVLVPLVVLVLLLRFDAKRFEPQIARAVKNATGRELTLHGDLHVAIFPWLAVRTGAGSLADASPAAAGGSPRGTAPHGTPPIAQWREAYVGARLLPLLLHGELSVDRVRVDGLQLRLERDAQGRANWDGLFTRDESSGGRTQLKDIAGLEVRGGSVEYVDAAAQTRHRLHGVNVDLGAWAPAKPLDLKFSGVLDASGSLPEVAFESALRASVGDDAVVIDGLKMSGRAQGGRFALQGWAWQVASPQVRFDVASRVITVQEFEAALADVATAGRVTLRLAPSEAAQGAGSQATGVTGEGALRVASPGLRASLARLGVDLPRTRDATVFGPFTTSFVWTLAPERLDVGTLALALDATHLEGSAARAPMKDGTLDFTLRGDRMDLARYLEPEDAKSDPFELPVEFLATLRARGTLALDEATLDDVRMKGVRIALLLDEKGLRTDAPQKP